MKRLALTSFFVVGLSFLAGCATSPTDVQDARTYQLKLAVTQTGLGQQALHSICEDGKCPERSRKVLAALPSGTPSALPDSRALLGNRVAESPRSFSVHFRWGWSKLDGEGRSEVEQVVSFARGKEAKAILIEGRTDPTGGLKYNKKLAINRANTVKRALIEAGVPAAVIETKAQKPCCDGDLRRTREQMRTLRRTDIELTITTK